MLIPVPATVRALTLSSTRSLVMNRFVEPSVILSVLMSACVTDRVPELCVIPVPYVKCVLVLAAVVNRFVDPAVTLSVLI